MRTLIVENGHELGELFGLLPPFALMLGVPRPLDEARMMGSSPWPRGTVVTPKAEMPVETLNINGDILPSRGQGPSADERRAARERGEGFPVGTEIPGRTVRVKPGMRFRVIDTRPVDSSDATLGLVGGKPGSSITAIALQPEDRNLLAEVPPDEDGNPAVAVIGFPEQWEVVQQAGPEIEPGIGRKYDEAPDEALSRKYGLDPAVGDWLNQVWQSEEIPGIESLEDLFVQYVKTNPDAVQDQQAPAAQAAKAGAASPSGRGRKLAPPKVLSPKALEKIPDLTDEDATRLRGILRNAGFTSVSEPASPLLPKSKFLVAIGPGPVQGQIRADRYAAAVDPDSQREDPEMEPPADVQASNTLDSYKQALDPQGAPKRRVFSTGWNLAWKYLWVEARERGLALPAGKKERYELFGFRDGSGAPKQGEEFDFFQIKVEEMPFVTLMGYVLSSSDGPRVLLLAHPDQVATGKRREVPEPPDVEPEPEMSWQELALYTHGPYHKSYEANPETADWPRRALEYLWTEKGGRKVAASQIRKLTDVPEDRVNDLVQDVFLRVLRSKSYDYSAGGKWTTWVGGIAGNWARDVWRKQKVGDETREKAAAGDPRLRYMFKTPEEVGVDLRNQESVSLPTDFRGMVEHIATISEVAGDMPFRGLRSRRGVPRRSRLDDPGYAALPSRGGPKFAAQLPEPAPERPGFLSRVGRRLAAPFREYGRVRREMPVQAGEEGFRQGFGDLAVARTMGKAEAVEQLRGLQKSYRAITGYYDSMRTAVYNAFAQSIPGEGATFDLTQRNPLKFLDAYEDELDVEDKTRFSQGFKRAFLDALLPQSREITRMATAIEDLAFDVRELVFGCFGIGLDLSREASAGASDAKASWRTLRVVAGDMVQRPQPYENWNEFVRDVKEAVRGVQQMFASVEAALVAIERAIREADSYVKNTEGEVIPCRFSRGEQRLDPAEFMPSAEEIEKATRELEQKLASARTGEQISQLNREVGQLRAALSAAALVKRVRGDFEGIDADTVDDAEELISRVQAAYGTQAESVDALLTGGESFEEALGTLAALGLGAAGAGALAGYAPWKKPEDTPFSQLGRYLGGKAAGKEAEARRQAGVARGKQARAEIPHAAPTREQALRLEASRKGLINELNPVYHWADQVWTEGDVLVGAEWRGTGGPRLEAPEDATAQEILGALKSAYSAGAKADITGRLERAQDMLGELYRSLASTVPGAVGEIEFLSQRWSRVIGSWARLGRQIRDLEMSLGDRQEKRKADLAVLQLSNVIVELMESDEEVRYWLSLAEDVLGTVEDIGYTHVTVPRRG